MKKLESFIEFLFCVFVLTFVSCANGFISKADLAKKRSSVIINVTYDVNGGGILEKSVYDFMIGTCPDEIPTPVRAGYIFEGWYTKKTGGTQFTKDFVLTDSITVYARWTYNSTPFRINLDYSKATEDGVTITNINNVPSRATVTYNDTVITIPYPQPEISQNATRDFAGYYDADGIKVCDRYGNLLPNAGKYTDSDGKWIYDLRQANETLVLYPRWIVNVKATWVTLDSTVYDVQIGETVTITGSYGPADATTTLKLTDDYYNIVTGFDDIAVITKGFVCENGRFSLEVKAEKRGIISRCIRCIFNDAGFSFELRVHLIKQIDPDNTINEDIYLPMLTGATIEIPFTPFDALYRFNVSVDSTRPSSGSAYYLLNYSIQDKNLVITSKGEINRSGYKDVFGDIPLKITDYYSGKTKNITVHIIANPEIEITPITSIPDNYTTSYDYNITQTRNNPYKFYSCTLEAGKHYNIFAVSSGNSYLGIFDSSYKKKYNFSYQNRSRIIFVPSETGTYYLVASSYFPDESEQSLQFYLFDGQKITDFSLSGGLSHSLSIGEIEDIYITWTPPESMPEFNNFSGSNRIAYTTYMDSVDYSKFTLKGVVPGTETVRISDSYSGIAHSYTVTVVSDPADEIDIVADTAASVDINDYTEFYLTIEKPAIVHRIQLEAGKTYHFQHVDSLWTSTGNNTDSYERNDCFFYLKDNDFKVLIYVDDYDMSYVCTASGNYYYIVTSWSLGSYGRGAFHIWGEDTQ